MKKLTGSQLFGGANEGAQNQGDNKKGAADLDSGP